MKTTPARKPKATRKRKQPEKSGWTALFYAKPEDLVPTESGQAAY